MRRRVKPVQWWLFYGGLTGTLAFFAWRKRGSHQDAGIATLFLVAGWTISNLGYWLDHDAHASYRPIVDFVACGFLLVAWFRRFELWKAVFIVTDVLSSALSRQFIVGINHMPAATFQYDLTSNMLYLVQVACVAWALFLTTSRTLGSR